MCAPFDETGFLMLLLWRVMEGRMPHRRVTHG